MTIFTSLAVKYNHYWHQCTKPPLTKTVALPIHLNSQINKAERQLYYVRIIIESILQNNPKHIDYKGVMYYLIMIKTLTKLDFRRLVTLS